MCDSRRCPRMDIGNIFWKKGYGASGMLVSPPTNRSEATTARKSAVCSKLVVSQTVLGSQPNRNR